MSPPEQQPGTGPGRHLSTSPAPVPDGADDGEPDGAVDDLLIRPFLLTGGRTRTSREDLRIESLVRSVPGVPLGTLRFEARRIVELTIRPTSLAELAVALAQPIGVVRVLVGDLVDSGTVSVVQVEEISLGLLERIRDRVRAL
ncbi:DUF742 domain-containing protein [Kineosporia sp. R_H_3]|uniref:DUF742 domain-containing protein n=1 Tax=Kineosporia sp. R_H_3 TaxID=1961848 RepID=UPI0018E930F9|nr:DUF742 domain-containing protein [Kineosporia sp. R_H_3]